MDLPLRMRLLGSFVGVVVLSGALTIFAGSFLINRMVIAEAERRVVLGLKTARAMWERRLDEALKACLVMAEGDIAKQLPRNRKFDPRMLDELRIKLGYDFLHVLDGRGLILATAYNDIQGARATGSPVIARVLAEGKPAAGLSILPLEALTTNNDSLAARTRIRVMSTPHSKPGGPQEISSAMVLEAAAPIMNDNAQVTGIVRVGTVINRNFEFVDFVRENVFTAVTVGTSGLKAFIMNRWISFLTCLCRTPCFEDIKFDESFIPPASRGLPEAFRSAEAALTLGVRYL